MVDCALIVDSIALDVFEASAFDAVSVSFSVICTGAVPVRVAAVAVQSVDYVCVHAAYAMRTVCVPMPRICGAL